MAAARIQLGSISTWGGSGLKEPRCFKSALPLGADLSSHLRSCPQLPASVFVDHQLVGFKFWYIECQRSDPMILLRSVGQRRDLAKSYKHDPSSNEQPSQQTRPSTSSASVMLTDSEQQSLRQEAKETSAYAKKAFAHLRPKTN